MNCRFGASASRSEFELTAWMIRMGTYGRLSHSWWRVVSPGLFFDPVINAPPAVSGTHWCLPGKRTTAGKNSGVAGTAGILVGKRIPSGRKNENRDLSAVVPSSSTTHNGRRPGAIRVHRQWQSTIRPRSATDRVSAERRRAALHDSRPSISSMRIVSRSNPS